MAFREELVLLQGWDEMWWNVEDLIIARLLEEL